MFCCVVIYQPASWILRLFSFAFHGRIHRLHLIFNLPIFKLPFWYDSSVYIRSTITRTISDHKISILTNFPFSDKQAEHQSYRMYQPINVNWRCQSALNHHPVDRMSNSQSKPGKKCTCCKECPNYNGKDCGWKSDCRKYKNPNGREHIGIICWKRWLGWPRTLLKSENGRKRQLKSAREWYRSISTIRR